MIPENTHLDMTGGEVFTPATLQGKWTILYFYPKDSTPGCTQEGKDFRDLLPEFQALNGQVFGVSRDSLKSHEKFKEKQNFNFELISDPDEVLCQAFGVIREKLNFGKTFLGIERSTFLLNPTGEIVHEWRKVKVKDHAAAVLSTLKECQAA